MTTSGLGGTILGGSCEGSTKSTDTKLIHLAMCQRIDGKIFSLRICSLRYKHSHKLWLVTIVNENYSTYITYIVIVIYSSRGKTHVKLGMPYT